MELLPGAAAALRAFHEAGYALVIATNQSGIARGLFGEEDFEAVQRQLEAFLDDEGVVLDGVYHCPHHPEFTGSCDCRKPAAGLFVHAAFDLDLDLSRSVWIGDRARDVTPALDFGGRGILVRSGYGADEEGRLPPGIAVEDDLLAAAVRVLESALPDAPGGDPSDSAPA